MEQLKELVYIVNRNKIKHIEVMDGKDSSPTRANQLYLAICDEEVQTDEEAYEKLFGNDMSRSAYRNTKAALYDKLINTLFFIDTNQSSYSDRQKAFYEAHKDFAAAQILLAKNARGVGVEMLERVLRKAIQFEIPELILPIARLLRMHYSVRIGNEKKHQEYNDLWNTYVEIDRWEGRCEELYSILMLYYTKGDKQREELQTMAKGFHLEVQPFLASSNSYKLHFYAGLIELFQYTCVNNYVDTIPICDRMIAFFEAKPFSANTPVQICLHHKLVAYMQLRDFKKGEIAARKSQRVLEEGAYNWFKNHEYLFLLAMQTQNFQKAYYLFLEAVEHKRFKFLPANVIELWGVYQAYVHLLIELNHIEKDQKDSIFTAYQINRFLENKPVFSKEKRGINIAILVIHILLYIQRKMYSEAIDRVDSIEKYCSRYLFKDDTMRSYYFIKQLLVIPQASFHKIAVRRHAAPILKKLESIKSDIIGEQHKIEIIPYEELWEIALSMIGTTHVLKNIPQKKGKRIRKELQ